MIKNNNHIKMERYSVIKLVLLLTIWIHTTIAADVIEGKNFFNTN
jgi:hypothetical protein